ncbi:ATP-binding protein [Bacillus taeanensis]|uniref:histidine kinase n=1 Tax=Bacillus taeanensis TaxID=273032 RepID=A0A366XYK1_9BACI|nr:ATP-binding protein [Bacillus taeanensis]RBW69001.1 PAS domain-containing sensor histidine kinase [Bacillus taeanensis]
MKEIKEYSQLIKNSDDWQRLQLELKALKEENQALKLKLRDQQRQLTTMKKSEKLLNKTLSHTYALIFRFKLNDYNEPVFTFIGGDLLEHLPISTEFYTNKKLDEVFREKLVSKLKSYYLKALKGKAEQFEMVFNGSVLLTSFLPVFENDNLIEVVGSILDVTKIKEIKEYVRSSEEKFRKIFDAAEDAIVLLNGNQRYIDANEAACRLFGISKEKLLNMHLGDLTAEARKKSFIEEWPSFIKEGTFKGETEVVRSDGLIQQVEYNAKAHILPDVHLAIIRDIKERKEIEDRLRNTETLKAIGELAAGIGHEIRNPLTSLKGFIQLLHSEIHNSSNSDQYFEIILSELQRLEEIINEFVLLSKPKTTLFEMKNVRTVLNETMALLESQATLKNVEIAAKFQNDLPLVRCESNQLKQVFINFIKNGIEAMPNGGKLSVHAQQTSSEEICIQIQDNGIGMDTDSLNQLGKPFYTTKEKGTGLGLMVSFKIIRDHLGHVKVRSKQGKGTTFEVYLPINCE